MSETVTATNSSVVQDNRIIAPHKHRERREGLHRKNGLISPDEASESKKAEKKKEEVGDGFDFFAVFYLIFQCLMKIVGTLQDVTITRSKLITNNAMEQQGIENLAEMVHFEVIDKPDPKKEDIDKIQQQNQRAGQIKANLQQQLIDVRQLGEGLVGEANADVQTTQMTVAQNSGILQMLSAIGHAVNRMTAK